MRGILEEDYGVPHRQVTWVVERSEDVEFDAADRTCASRWSRRARSSTTMLAEGEISGHALARPSRGCSCKGDKRIARLFPNYKDIELDYFRKTGIFPIMHVTTIKQEIVDKYPWVPTNLVKAFEEAKQIAYRRVANPRMVPLAWVRTALEEQEQVLGPDPWAYGLGAGQPQEPRDDAALHPPAGHDRPARWPLDELFVDTDLGDAGGSDAI